MPEKQLHKALKVLMIVVILLLAYLLPGICVRRTADDQRAERAGSGERQEGDAGLGATEDTDENTGGASGTENKLANLSSDTQQPSASTKGTIVLDSGHGGSDPGMIGVGGVEEKGINLQVTLILGKLLEQQGFRVVYTRSDDSGLYDAETSNKKAQDMQRRCAIIEQEKPLLSISIHQNSYTDPSVYGPQVFYFEHSAEGKELASCIQEQMNTQLEIAKPRVIKGNTNYYILKRSEGVTVLVECAFLSNPQEAEKIQTEEYQNAVAQAICSGVLDYLKDTE